RLGVLELSSDSGWLPRSRIALRDGNKSSVAGLLVIRQSPRRLRYAPPCCIMAFARAFTASCCPPGYLTLKLIFRNPRTNDAKSSAVKCVDIISFLRIRVAVILSGAALDQSHIPCARAFL